MKNLKNSKTSGISLVALIVTITVLIILTAAVIVTFMEGGIIDRAKEAVFKSDIRTYQEILAVKNAEKQIELATGNGEGGLYNATELAEIQEIIPEFKEEYKDLIAISNGEIVLGARSDEPYSTWLAELGIVAGKTGDETVNTPTVHNGIIPEGGIYYVSVEEDTAVGDYSGATKILYAGDSFPETVNTGDVYVYGDYEYRYNMFWYEIWSYGSNSNYWSMHILNPDKTEYGIILEEINGVPMRNMEWAFRYSNIITAPTIPNSVENMYAAFAYCDSLEDGPIIPNSVVFLEWTFRDCISLTGEIEINATNLTYSDCFAGTVQPIVLTGTCPILSEIAATAVDEFGNPSGNVTVKNINN